MKTAQISQTFWKDKRVFLTGHTGFKGSWLSLWLASMGAKVTGYSLAPNTTPNLYDVLNIDSLIERSHIDDIRDLETLQRIMSGSNPDVVIHMAAQPLVRHSYANPVETYSTNVMGTVHVLESIRSINSVRATVVVTTDKCYENKEWIWGYRENESMGGYDPYSSSKGCAELVTSAYRKSFFSGTKLNITNIATARAGNVIGGGDWSEDRLIPDAIKAFNANEVLLIRNPMSTRPWQHVLEPLSGYLILAQKLYDEGSSYASAWNFGPRDEDSRQVSEVLELLINQWGNSASWTSKNFNEPHEANLLKLDCSKALTYLGWTPKWSLETAIQKIVQWQNAYHGQENMREVSLAQINQYTGTK